MEAGLCCGRVYDESLLKGVFIDEFHEPVWFSMYICWGTNKKAALRILAQYAVFLSKLKDGTKSNNTRSKTMETAGETNTPLNLYKE